MSRQKYYKLQLDDKVTAIILYIYVKYSRTGNDDGRNKRVINLLKKKHYSKLSYHKLLGP